MGKTAGMEFFTVVIEQWEPAASPAPRLHSSAVPPSSPPPVLSASSQRLAVCRPPAGRHHPPFGNVRLSLGRSLSGFKVRHRSRRPNRLSAWADESSGLQ